MKLVGKMSKEKRQSHLKKIQVTSTSVPCSSKSCDQWSSAPLTMEVENASSLTSVPVSVLTGIWKKAEELLLSPTSVTAAPGNSSQARMVESRSGTRPHLVVPGTAAGQFKCDDDCLNFKALKLCSHTVAVSHLKMIVSVSSSIGMPNPRINRVLLKSLFTACLKVVARRVAEHLEKESNNKVLQIGLID